MRFETKFWSIMTCGLLSLSATSVAGDKIQPAASTDVLRGPSSVMLLAADNTQRRISPVHGNNGIGNGQDAPPPGWLNPRNPHFGDQQNDERTTSPGRK